jgi:protein subunit release factor B
MKFIKGYEMALDNWGVIRPEDLNITQYSADPDRGQHVHSDKKGVTILHIPSKIEVSSDVGRSHYANRAIAMGLLYDALVDWDGKVVPSEIDLLKEKLKNHIVTINDLCQRVSKTLDEGCAQVDDAWICDYCVVDSQCEYAHKRYRNNPKGLK